MIVKELFATLGLDVDEGAFNAAEAAMGGLKGGLAAVGAALAGMAVGFVAMVKTTSDAGDNIDELAARTGVSTDALQKLGYAASFSGVGLDELAVAMNYLAKKGSKDVEKDLGKIADRVKELTDQGRGPEAAAYAISKMGRAGARMIPVLRGGSAELKAMGEEAVLLGKVMSETAIRDSAAFNDSIDRLSAAWVGLRNDVIAPLLPMLTNVAKGMLEWFKANRELIKQRIDKTIALFLKVVGFLWKVLRGVATVLDVLITHWKTFAAVLGGVALAALIQNIAAVTTLTGGYIAAGWAAFAAGAKAVAAWVAAAAPVVLLGLLLAAVALAIEDVWVALHGGDSLIGSLGPKWTKFLDDILEDHADDWWFIKALKAALRFVTDIDGGLRKMFAYKENPAEPLYDPNRKREEPGAFKQFVRGVFGPSDMDKATAEVFGGGASPAASVMASPSVGGKSVSVQGGPINANWVINAAPGQSPEEIANAVRQNWVELRDAELRATMAAVE